MPPDSIPTPADQEAARAAVGEVYARESRRVLATLIRLLGDFDVAEDALQEALAAALESWPRDGVPRNPRSWLVSTGRFRAIDRMRRHTRHREIVDEIARSAPDRDGFNLPDDDALPDDRLRLIFTCCHPALPPEARVALTLREVCGLTTEEIARAFLTSAPTLAQRIVRAKRKIREAGIPYEVPDRGDLDDRLDSVLQVIYLVFNEGYTASHGTDLTRPDVSQEAILLGRLLAELLPEAEALGLLGLMLLTEARRPARTTPHGDIILLEDQDRSLWDRSLIDEGLSLVRRAMSSGEVGVYTIQAAIAAVHAGSPSTNQTDWPAIVRLYDALLSAAPSPIVELNRAVAVAMQDGPEAGVELICAILERGDLVDYHLAHAAMADLYRKLGRREEAMAAYQRAMDLAQLDPERRFLEGRIEELGQA